MAPKRPPNAVLGEVTKVLALALASCGGGDSSQDAPVVVKLRTLVLALLDSCADTSLASEKDILAVIQLTGLLLERLPSVLSCGAELTVMCGLLRMATHATGKHRPVIKSIIGLMMNVLGQMPPPLQSLVTGELMMGAMELILDAEQQLLNLQCSATAKQLQLASPAWVSAFCGMWDLHKEHHPPPLQQQQQPLSEEGGAAGAVGSGLKACESANGACSLPPLNVELHTIQACLEAGECASQLLSSLLLKQPQLLGPMLPPVVAPALLQLMVHGEAPVQVTLMHTLTVMLEVAGPTSVPVIQVTTVMLWVLEAWTQGNSSYGSNTATAAANDTSGSETTPAVAAAAAAAAAAVVLTSELWCAALALVLRACVTSLAEMQVLPLLADRLCTVLVDAITAPTQSSSSLPAVAVTLLSVLELLLPLIVRQPGGLGQCSRHVVRLLPLLLRCGGERDAALVGPLLSLLCGWLDGPEVAGCMRQDLTSVSSPSGSCPWLAPLLQAVPAPGFLTEWAGGSEAVLGGAVGAMDDSGRPAKRGRQKLRQTQLAFRDDGQISTQAATQETLSQPQGESRPNTHAGFAVSATSSTLTALPCLRDPVPLLLVNHLLQLAPMDPAGGMCRNTERPPGWSALRGVQALTLVITYTVASRSRSARPVLLVLLGGLVQRWLSVGMGAANKTLGAGPSVDHAMVALLSTWYQCLLLQLECSGMTGAESQAESPKHQGHAAAALVGFLLAGTADLAEELLVRVLDAPSAEAFQDNSTEAAGPVPAATDRVAASSHRGDVLGDAMSALVALAGCSRLTCLSISRPNVPSSCKALASMIMSRITAPPATANNSSSPAFSAAVVTALPAALLLPHLAVSTTGRVTFSLSSRESLSTLPSYMLKLVQQSSLDVSPTSQISPSAAAVTASTSSGVLALSHALFLLMQLCACTTIPTAAAALRAACYCCTAHNHVTAAALQPCPLSMHSTGSLTPSGLAPTAATNSAISLTAAGTAAVASAVAAGVTQNGGGKRWPSVISIFPILDLLHPLESTDPAVASGKGAGGGNVASLVTLLAAMQIYLTNAGREVLAGGGQVLRRLMLLLSHDSPIVRRAAAPLLPLLLRPAVLLELYGTGSAAPLLGGDAVAVAAELRHSLSSAQELLMADVRGWLEEAWCSAVHNTVLQACVCMVPLLHPGDSSLVPLFLLLGCLGKEDLALRSSAISGLDHYCAIVGRPLPELLLSSREVLEYVGRHVCDSPALLRELLRLVGMGQCEVARAVAPHVIGWACMNGRREELELLAHMTGSSVSGLFANYADHAIAHAFWVGSQRFEAFVAFVDEIMAPEDDFLTVTRITARDVARQVVIMAGQLEEEAWDSGGVQPPSDLIRRGNDYLDSLARITGLTGSDAAAELLNGQSVSVLLKDLGDLLGGAGVRAGVVRSELDTLQALRSLAVLIRLLGCYVGNHAPHIMAVLTAALQGVPSLRVKMQGLRSLHVFVDALCASAPTLLERMAVQVAVVLLPALEEGGGGERAAAIAIMEGLVLTHRKHIKGALSRMPPLPTVPGLEAVCAVLADAQQLADPSKHLQVLLNSLRHESLSVRHAALGELKLFLTQHKTLVGDLVGGAMALDGKGGGRGSAGGVLVSRGNGGGQLRRSHASCAALVSEMVAALLRCCDNTMRTQLGMSLRIRCAECLGLLGALDPARLSVHMPAPPALCDPAVPLAFEKELVVRHLVRILETTCDISTLDFTTYAIQSVLQHYSRSAADDPGVTLADTGVAVTAVERRRRGAPAAVAGGAEVAGGEGEGLFKSLPLEVKPLVAPYLSSRFTLEDKVRPCPEEGVVFGSKQHSFRRWLERWLKSLIRWTHGPSQSAFAAVTSVLKWDLPLMTFLLPHVVQNVMAGGSPQGRKAATEEVLAVLQAACPDSDAEVAEMELYLQVLFSCLDILGRYVKDVRAAAQIAALAAAAQAGVSGSRVDSPDSSLGRLPEEAGRVHTFLEAIPKQVLAQAAFRCGAHARALQYYETYARGVVGGGLNIAASKRVEFESSQVSFLIEIYGQLEEPDGLGGLVSLRHGGLNHSDQILAAEKSGCWSEALALYEQGMGMAAAAGTGDNLAVAEISTTAYAASQMPTTSAVTAVGSKRNAAAAIDSVRAALNSSTTFVGGTIAVGNSGGGGGVSGLSGMVLGHLRCLLQMGHLTAVLQQVDGLLARGAGGPGGRGQLAAVGVAAAWRLGRWEVLQEYLHVCNTPTHGSKPLSPSDEWEVTLGTLMLDLQGHATSTKLQLPGLDPGHPLYAQQRSTSPFSASSMSDGLSSARADILAILPAISMESYVVAYPHVVRLHMLQELQDVSLLLQEPSLVGHLERGKRLRWGERLEATQATLATQEPLLSLRRQLSETLGDSAQAGNCWLQQVKLCRTTGHHEAAAPAVLEALFRGVPGAVGEHGKLLWNTGNQRRAIEELQAAQKRWRDPKTHSRVVGGVGNEATVGVSVRERAKVAVQLCGWVQGQGQLGYLELRGLFEGVVKLEPTWEKGHFHFARYLDHLYYDAKRRQTQPKEKGAISRLGNRSKVALGEERSYFDYLPEIISSYSKAVAMNGSGSARYAQQALPRMLTLYCDYGTDALSRRSMGSKERAAATSVVNLMKEVSRSVPPVSWLITLPQLISRMCHPHTDVNEVIHSILIRITEAFPHQALWSLASCHRSNVKSRSEAAKSVMDQARRVANPSTISVYKSYMTFMDQLIKLCFWNAPANKYRVSSHAEFPQLVGMLPLEVMIPVQECFNNPLPPVPSSSTSGKQQHVQVVTIAKLRDEVTMMRSMMKPKKIIFVGSDGRDYPFLAKPKDDLRKDYRLMDYAGVLNSLLSKEASARRRDLRLRTYAVLPLTEDCGLLQWLNNLLPLKMCCEEAYAMEGLYKKDVVVQIKKIFDEHKESLSKSKMMGKVLGMVPPRMHKWMLAKFPEPAAWLQARLNFTRTNAVWCMTGHMLGLGDRHGENIMIDCSAGDTVHVDFGCLFDKGLTLEVPEMVPFRLTQNIVDCFGVTGVEGAFRKSAEVTLKVMRQHKSTLMTCAETFLHDPLVDWAEKKGSGKASVVVESEQDNPMAKDALAVMDGRLSGSLLGVLSQPSVPLSCEGHAHRLITDATDRENLGRMYIWWMAWF